MIELSGITKSFRRGSEPPLNILRGVDLRIGRGDFVAITGGSGTGKTTLMNILGLLDRADGGRYRLDDDDVTGLGDGERTRLRNRAIGFVFQQFHLLPRTSAVDNVMLPLSYGPFAEPRKKAVEALCSVGLEDRLTHTPEQLSGGQQQRVAIARALVTKPKLLLADEPTGNLDPQAADEVMSLFRTLNAGGTTVLLITHDAAVARVARRVVSVRDGALFEKDSVQ